MRQISKHTQALLLDKQEKISAIKSKYDELFRDITSKVNSLVREFNSNNRETIETLEKEYQELAVEVMNITDDLHNKSQSYMNDRSDKWHDTDPGASYQLWSEEWLDLYNEMEENRCFYGELSIEFPQIPKLVYPPFKP